MKRIAYRSLAGILLCCAACQDIAYVQDSPGSPEPTENCAPAGISALACRDFESGTLSPRETQDGEITLETVEVFAGDASMKAFSSGAESYAQIVESFDPINSGTIYFRVFLFVPEGNTVGTTKVLNLSASAPMQFADEIGVDINISGERSIDIYQHGNAARFTSQPDMVPEGVWFCVNGSYSISETAGATSVWLDNRLAVSTTASADSIINGGVSEFRAGIGWIGDGQLSSTVYFDNILVAAVPVSCSDF